jgi:quercetin dioxygenase-like cupin family protein
LDRNGRVMAMLEKELGAFKEWVKSWLTDTMDVLHFLDDGKRIYISHPKLGEGVMKSDINEDDHYLHIHWKSPKGAFYPAHRHTNSDELVYVRSGLLEWRLQDRVVGPGESIFNAKNVYHSAEVLEDAEYDVYFFPPLKMEIKSERNHD